MGIPYSNAKKIIKLRKRKVCANADLKARTRKPQLKKIFLVEKVKQHRRSKPC